MNVSECFETSEMTQVKRKNCLITSGQADFIKAWMKYGPHFTTHHTHTHHKPDCIILFQMI